MNPGVGAPGKDARLVIGALIVKHNLGLSGEDTIQIIRENPYIQYFLGIKEFTSNPVFDSGLFTSILKRIGVDTFNAMHKEIIEKALNINVKTKRKGLIVASKETDHITNFASNLKLLCNTRIAAEEIIDTLCVALSHKTKPPTYRLRAFNEAARAVDETDHTIKENKKAIGRQISFLKRDIKNIHKMLDIHTGKLDRDKFTVIKGACPIPLNNMDLKRFWVFQQVLEQQQKMYKSGRNNCPDRITDLEHPFVRPVAKTKAKFRILKTRVHLLQQVF